jgi:hypothetical protein
MSTSVTVCLLGQPSQIPPNISVTLDGEAMTPQIEGCWILSVADVVEQHLVLVRGTGILPQTANVTTVVGTSQMVTLPLVQAWPGTGVTVCLTGQPSDMPANISVTVDGMPMTPQDTGCWTLSNLDPSQPHQVNVTGTGIAAQTSIVSLTSGQNQMVTLPLTPLTGVSPMTLLIGAGVVLALIFFLPAVSARRNPRRRRYRLAA